MESRILEALAGSPGMSAKEIARELGESTPIIMEILLGLAASGALKQRTVGRDQVFSVPRKRSVPTPREILPTGPSVKQQIAVPNLRFMQRFGRIARQPMPTLIDFELEADLPAREWSLPPQPTMYDRIGGTITLDIGDSPITARFTSVEQLHRFLTNLIDNERAGQVPEKGQV